MVYAEWLLHYPLGCQIEILHTPIPEQILATLQQIELQVTHFQSFEELDHPHHDSG